MFTFCIHTLAARGRQSGAKDSWGCRAAPNNCDVSLSFHMVLNELTSAESKLLQTPDFKLNFSHFERGIGWAIIK